jgi:ATP-binding cassette subfamily B protein
MLDKSILLLDEPTTGLDEMNKRIVIDALLKLSRGKTTVMVTHNLNLAARADLIVYVDGGKVQYQGTHDELMKQAGLYEQLFREHNSTNHQNGKHPSDPVELFHSANFSVRP